MSWWRLKDPGLFSVEFHEAIKKSVGDHIVAGYHTERAALKGQKQWTLFIYCLRRYPHKNSPFEPLYTRRTRVAFDPVSGGWFLWISVKQTAASLLAGAEILDGFD